MCDNRKIIVAIALLCLIIVLFTQIELSQGNPSLIEDIYPILPSITIESNGTISPSDMPVKQVGDIYYLTGNISHYTIFIKRDNITLDGKGFTLLGNTTMAGAGINVGANNVTVKNFVIKTFPVGIAPYKGAINIINNTISDCNAAVHFAYESHILVSGNVLKDNDAGIHLRQCNFNTIDGNIIINNTKGIYLQDNSQNTISDNTIRINLNGAYLSNARTNFFMKNNFTLNACGANMVASKDNQFYLNNFESNTVDAGLADRPPNSWNNGSLGNYWSSYAGSDVDGDGVGDSPHVLDANNRDNYPLMSPWFSLEVNVLALENSTYFGSFSLNVTVNKAAVWMGYSLDGQSPVTIAGNTTLRELSLGLHNVTVYARDALGNTCSSETVSFNIAEKPQPFSMVPVAAASVATIAVVRLSLLVFFKKRKR